MSLLTLIQSHCKTNTLAVPSSVTGSTDTTVIQLWEVLKDILDEMVRESNFNVVTVRKVWTLVPTSDQGALQGLLAGAHPVNLLFETFFDLTQQRPLTGPLTETEWEELLALPSAGTWYKYRIWQDHLWIFPVPTAPLSQIAFEYTSSECVYDVSSNKNKSPQSMDDDTDQFLFPEIIIKRGLAYRWKQIKGLPYQADETAYYKMLNNYIARDKVKRRINVSEGVPVDLKPGIFVPSNSWTV